MPRLTVTATTTKLAGRTSRKSITFRNSSTGLTCYWGFEPTITANEAADTCGVPLLAGESKDFAGDDRNLHRPLYFITAAGSTFLYYTEN